MAYLKSYGLRDALKEPLNVQNMSLCDNESFTEQMLEMINYKPASTELNSDAPKHIIDFMKKLEEMRKEMR